jgi:RHS repeat-associated protein
MAIVTIVTFAEDGTKTRIERTSYDYNTGGIRVSSLHEIDVDADGIFETSKLTEYLNDPLNITGYSQVIKQTETDLNTGEQANIIHIIGRNRISQITVKNGTEQELYFTFDGHGSTRALTDFVGAIVELYTFDAYGNAIGFDPSVALTEFLYSGEQFDSKIGQQYLRQRYYDPATGRFNRLDPFFGDLNDPQSLHKYLYCHADSINYTDPSGLIPLPILFLLGVTIGAGVGAGLGYWINGNTGAQYGALGGALVGLTFPLATAVGALTTAGTLAATVGASLVWGSFISGIALFTYGILVRGPDWWGISKVDPQDQKKIALIIGDLDFASFSMWHEGIKPDTLEQAFKQAGHNVTKETKPKEDRFVELCNSNDYVFVISHGGENSVNEYTGFLLGGTQGSFKPEVVTSEEIKGQITNKNVIVVGATCFATAQNGAMAKAINGRYFVGMNKSINSAESLSVLLCGIAILNNKGQINNEIKTLFSKIDILE